MSTHNMAPLKLMFVGAEGCYGEGEEMSYLLMKKLSMPQYWCGAGVVTSATVKECLVVPCPISEADGICSGFC